MDNDKSKEIPSSARAIQYFFDAFSSEILLDKIKPIKKMDKLALSYFNDFNEVMAVFDRLIKYEKYFKDFYPPKTVGISESEVIEYHLRSYIEDFYILQERIRKITIRLIDDIPFYKIENPNYAAKILKHLSEQIHKKFKNITSNLRREHVHNRSITELDLAKGKLINILLSPEFLKNVGIQVNKPVLEKQEVEFIASSKNKHILQSAKNSESLRKLKDWFASRFIYVFASLNGHKIKDLKM